MSGEAIDRPGSPAAVAFVAVGAGAVVSVAYVWSRVAAATQVAVITEVFGVAVLQGVWGLLHAVLVRVFRKRWRPSPYLLLPLVMLFAPGVANPDRAVLSLWVTVAIAAWTVLVDLGLLEPAASRTRARRVGVEVALSAAGFASGAAAALGWLHAVGGEWTAGVGFLAVPGLVAMSAWTGNRRSGGTASPWRVAGLTFLGAAAAVGVAMAVSPAGGDNAVWFTIAGATTVGSAVAGAEWGSAPA